MGGFFCTSENDRDLMLKAIGVDSIDDLYARVPKKAFLQDLGLGKAMPEYQLRRYMSERAGKNLDMSSADCFIGAGCYSHYIPAAVDHLIQRSEFMTSYTPYQSEVSQGSLSIMFEFQTMIARLTGMDIANGSMYDGATALAEAVLMAHRVNSRKKIYFANPIHPNYKEVVSSATACIGMQVVDELSDEVACIVVQQPDFFGDVADVVRDKADKVGAILIVVVTEILALGILPPPSSADVVVGDAQSLAASMSFGGPHLGFFACKSEFLRQIPGRISGQTIDAEGNRAFTLTISAREQHIKRGRATSNICTNQFLLALAFTIHAALLGEEGLKRLAVLNHERCVYLADQLTTINGVKVLNRSFFNEIAVVMDRDVDIFVKQALQHNVIAGYPVDKNTMLIAVTELNSYESIDKYVDLVRNYLG